MYAKCVCDRIKCAFLIEEQKNIVEVLKALTESESKIFLKMKLFWVIKFFVLLKKNTLKISYLKKSTLPKLELLNNGALAGVLFVI